MTLRHTTTNPKIAGVTGDGYERVRDRRGAQGGVQCDRFRDDRFG
jgi:hypothetical protein